MSGLDEMTPSVELLHALASPDRSSLDFDGQLSAIAGWERIIGFATACQNDLLAAVNGDDEVRELGWAAGPSARWLAERVGVALGISGASAQHRMDTATTLTQKLPGVTAALRSGVVTVHHARVAALTVSAVDEEFARAVDSAVMVDEGWRTPAQFGDTLQRVVREVDPAGAAARHRAARRERRVSLRAEPDGMCSLWALLPAEDGQLVHKVLDAHARSSKARNAPGDDRTLDARRADALVDLTTRTSGTAGPRTHGRAPQVNVTVALSTLIGADDAPVDLTGYGWIDAETGRRIAADPTAVWRRLIVDPPSGRLLDYGRTTYTSPQDLRDFITTRDRTCRFPTCHRPAVGCDADHRHHWQNGCSTRPRCLDCLCRTHHRLKHEGGWTHHRDPDTDDSVWTDPTGTEHRKPATRLPTPAPVKPPTVRAQTVAPGDGPDEPSSSDRRVSRGRIGLRPLSDPEFRREDQPVRTDRTAAEAAS